MTVKGPRSGAATLKVIETGPKTFPHQADRAISKSVPRRVTQNNEGVRCASEGFYSEEHAAHNSAANARA
jgi:hypothetical protein